MSEPSHCETCNYYGGHADWCESYKENEWEIQLLNCRLDKLRSELEQSHKWSQAWKAIAKIHRHNGIVRKLIEYGPWSWRKIKRFFILGTK